MVIILYAFTFLLGFCTLKSLLPNLKNLFLIIGFSLSLGLLTETFITFLLMIFNLNNRFCLLTALLGYFFIISIFSLCKLRKNNNCTLSVEDNSEKIKPLILYSFILFYILFALFVTLQIIKNPYGGWDGTFIWNLRSKFFFVSTELNLDWRTVYNPVIAWSHLDYPVMLPVFNFSKYLILGAYSYFVNMFSSVFISFTVLFTLIGGIKEYRGFNNALLAGIVLAVTKPFLSESITQYSDILLSLFILNSFVSLFLFEKYENKIYLFLTFLFAASCTFCKNEGILFFLIFCLLFFVFYKKNFLKYIICGTFIPFICVLYSKLFLFGKSDLIDNQSTGIILSKLFSLYRFRTIFNAFLHNFLQLNILLFTFFSGILSGFINDNKYKNFKFMLFLCLLICYAAYFMVYMLTPRELVWHLDTSCMRLFLHYIPLFVYFIFIWFNCFTEKSDDI